MELFNEYKNKYFQCIQNIINSILAGEKYEQKDMIDFFGNNTFNELEASLVWDILDKQLKSNNEDSSECNKIKLFKKNNLEYLPIINSPIPIRPTNIECKWLKMLLEDPKGKMNLNDKVIEKLADRLKSIEIQNTSEYWIQKNIDKNGDEFTDELNKSIIILSTAIQEGKLIKYMSVDKEGNEYNNICFPYKIEYSIKNNKYRVVVLPRGYDRAIKINVSNFKNIEIVNKIDTATNEKILDFIRSKKNLNKPLVLEVESKFNTVERCFALFSYYNKEAYYNKEKNKHILKVYYHSFDEAEIIRDILSLGSAVVVVEPTEIRNKIIERIRKALYNA